MKNQYCQPFYYVRPDGGELYRIMPDTLSVSESGGIAYQCEHVLATLIDNVLFGYHVVGNLGVYTDDVIRYILDHQLVKNWVLYECDFKNQFEYGWEQESLLSALFSVLSPLSSPMIVTDTTVYPWRLSLKKLVTTGRPEMYVRRRHNMTSYNRGRDPQNIVTRLYPLGYGEGVNQLTIKGVNNGVPYIQSPKEITDKYGIKSACSAALQAVIKPVTIYSDNVGGGSNTASNVTASSEEFYLPAEFEVHGAWSYANGAEQNYQTQLAYYKAGNSKVKYKHNATGTAASVWCRSACYHYSTAFCFVNISGGASNIYAYYSLGVAPLCNV